MAITWNELKPDFSGANDAMKNAMTGFSQAGTVFGKIREGILAEEQRAIENARAVEAAALERADLDERIRANKADEANAAATITEQIRHAKEIESIRAAELKLQQDAAARQIANEEAGKSAAHILYEMQHGATGVSKLLDELKAAENMTPEMFEKAKLHGGMINPSTNQVYADLNEYRKVAKDNFDRASADFATRYPELGNAGFEDLANSIGLERQFERLYWKNGGSGSATPFMPNYITRGALTEHDMAKADMNAKIEAAKNVRLSEREYGTWNGLVSATMKVGIPASDAQAIASVTLGVQRALQKKGITVSNKDVYNGIMETAKFPDADRGALGRGWDWLWGSSRVSLGQYGMNNAVDDFTKLWEKPGTGNPEKEQKNTPNSINNLPQNMQNNANQLLREERIKHENSSDEAFDEQAAEKRIVDALVKEDQRRVSVFIPDVPSLLSNYTNAELKLLGLTKKSTVLTSEQLKALMRIDRSKVMSYVPHDARRDFYMTF